MNDQNLRPPQTQQRVPYAPLAAFAKERNQQALAHALGVSRRSLCRWSDTGVPLNQADDVAVRLGAHPWEIWGDDWWPDA